MKCWGIGKVLRQKCLSATNADGVESSRFLRGGFLCQLLFMQVEKARPLLGGLDFPCLYMGNREMVSR